MTVVLTMLRLDQYHITPSDFESIQLLGKQDKAAKFISVVGGGGKSHLIKWLAAIYKTFGFKVCVTTTTKTYLPDNGEFETIIELDDFKKLTDTNTQSGTVTFLYQQRITTAECEPDKAKGFSLEELKQIEHFGIFDVYIVEADGAKHLPIKAPAGHEPCICDLADLVISVTGAEAIFSIAEPSQIHRWEQFSQLTSCISENEINESVVKNLIEAPEGMFKNSPVNANRLWIINKMDLCSDTTRLETFVQELVKSQTQTVSSVWLTQLNQPKPLIKKY